MNIDRFDERPQDSTAAKIFKIKPKTIQSREEPRRGLFIKGPIKYMISGKRFCVFYDDSITGAGWWEDWKAYPLRYEQVSDKVWQRMVPKLDALLGVS